MNLIYVHTSDMRTRMDASLRWSKMVCPGTWVLYSSEKKLIRSGVLDGDTPVEVFYKPGLFRKLLLAFRNSI